MNIPARNGRPGPWPFRNPLESTYLSYLLTICRWPWKVGGGNWREEPTASGWTQRSARGDDEIPGECIHSRKKTCLLCYTSSLLICTCSFISTIIMYIMTVHFWLLQLVRSLLLFFVDCRSGNDRSFGHHKLTRSVAPTPNPKPLMK